jgi:hypothetical protein
MKYLRKTCFWDNFVVQYIEFINTLDTLTNIPNLLSNVCSLDTCINLSIGITVIGERTWNGAQFKRAVDPVWAKISSCHWGHGKYVYSDLTKYLISLCTHETLNVLCGWLVKLLAFSYLLIIAKIVNFQDFLQDYAFCHVRKLFS